MPLSREKQRLAIVAILLSWCASLLSYRIYLEFDWLAVGLMWNLVLAAVPLMWSAAFQTASARNRPLWAGIFFFLWLLFLPNAPYILTDLIHLKPQPRVPFWYLLAMLLSCAGTGTMLGYLSLFDVHCVVERRFGKKTGWAIAAGSLLLCGFGIYLGRFLRWNSWDAFTHPFQLLKAITRQFIDPGSHPHPVAVTLVFGIGLIIGYLTLRVIAASARPE